MLERETSGGLRTAIPSSALPPGTEGSLWSWAGTFRDMQLVLDVPWTMKHSPSLYLTPPVGVGGKGRGLNSHTELP